jgi:pre-mRNA-processing factor 19
VIGFCLHQFDCLFLIRVYQAKQWDLLKVFNDHTALATGIRFGSNANYLASSSMDRSLKFYEQLTE